MDTPLLIEVRDLSFRYPDGVEALKGLRFDLAAGETVALLGPNGSGKTTFLHLLVGLLRGKGTIRVCGRAVDRDSIEYVRSQIGLLFQDSNDQLFMPTVDDDVAFGPRNAGRREPEVRRGVEEALAQVGLSQLSERAPHHLSEGQKRLVALAGLLACQPKILLLDEPATFLDPPARTHLVRTLQELPQAKVLVTHDAALARSLAQRAVFFRDGRVTDQGSVDAVANRQSWR